MSDLTPTSTKLAIQKEIAALGRYSDPSLISTPTKEAIFRGLATYAQALKEGRLPAVKSTDLEAYNSPTIGALLKAQPEGRPVILAFLMELCQAWASLFASGQTQTLGANLAAQGLVNGKLVNRISPAGLLLCLCHRFNKTGPFVEAETGYFSADSIADCVKQYVAWQTALDLKAQEEAKRLEQLEHEKQAQAFKQTKAFEALMEGLAKTISDMQREAEKEDL